MSNQKENLKKIYNQKSTKELTEIIMEYVGSELKKMDGEPILPEYELCNQILEERIKDKELYGFLWELIYRQAA